MVVAEQGVTAPADAQPMPPPIEVRPPVEGVVSPHFQAYIESRNRPDLSEKINSQHRIVYFSAEYGKEGLGYAGGLGMLSGDHELEAESLDVPSLFIGLQYQERKVQRIVLEDGHFVQKVDTKPLPAPAQLGMELMTNIHVQLKGEDSFATGIKVWKNKGKNDHAQQILLTAPGEVYPSHNSSNERLRNNVIMGFGGFQVVRQLQDQGIMAEPAAYHLNESATVLGALAALDDLTVRLGNTPEAYTQALAHIRDKTILTNHTLVPAAEGTFTWGQCQQYVFSNLTSPEVRSRLESFMKDRGSSLRLLDLAMYLVGPKKNGVSQFHAEEATRIFRESDHYGESFYGSPVEFRGVTNGVNIERWNPIMVNYLKKKKVIDTFGFPTADSAQRIDQLPTSELWNVKQDAVTRFRTQLAAGVRQDAYGEKVPLLDQFGNKVTLPENAIVIGDARRFADYKRRWMMFKKPEELKRILTAHPDVHIFIAGKAHPHDGVALSQLTYVLDTIARDELFKERIHFLDNWDPELAKLMGQACHGWMNNPRVGEEACGTSGEKWAYGGALNGSTRDGFYAELPDDSYYMISGDTNSEAEYASYYQVMEQIITDSETDKTWATNVKRQWKGGFLDIANGARMVEEYLEMTIPPEEQQKAA